MQTVKIWGIDQRKPQAYPPFVRVYMEGRCKRIRINRPAMALLGIKLGGRAEVITSEGWATLRECHAGMGFAVSNNGRKTSSGKIAINCIPDSDLPPGDFVLSVGGLGIGWSWLQQSDLNAIIDLPVWDFDD